MFFKNNCLDAMIAVLIFRIYAEKFLKIFYNKIIVYNILQAVYLLLEYFACK